MSDKPSPSLFDEAPSQGAGGSEAGGERAAGVSSGPAVYNALGDGPFADGKAADALRTIGEVAKALGIRQHVLRYWEEQFPMLRPLKRSGGRRYYRPDDIALVQRIDRLVHREGYTLRGARLVLQGKGEEAEVERVVAPAPAAKPGSAAARPADIDRLRQIRARLATALG